jgi:hypothetical protein
MQASQHLVFKYPIVFLQLLQVCLISWFSIVQKLKIHPKIIPGHGKIKD